MTDQPATETYLDHAASTPMRPEAVAAMVDVLEGVPGNPSGRHRWARDARRLLDDARDQVAAFVGCGPGEVIFTSGGTEADNLAINGAARAGGGWPFCLATDHPAVIEPVLQLSGVLLPVGADGRVRLDELPRAMAETPAGVVSAALVNNEVGTIQPLDELAEVVRTASPHTLVHADAVATASWFDLPTVSAAADLVTISGHKIGGPKGIGALIVRGDAVLQPVQLGGGQERELRAGTQNVAGAVALGAACAAALVHRPIELPRLEALRARLLRGLAEAVPDLVVTGAGAPAAPHIVHVCMPGVEREALLFLLDDAGVAASAGSSCASGALETSHVLEAMGVDHALAAGALRLSMGWSTTEAEVDRAIEVVGTAVARLRAPVATYDLGAAGS